MKSRRFKKFRNYLIASLVAVLAVILFCDWKIRTDAAPFLYSNYNDLPENNTALLLGTSNKRKSGERNPYFYNRIDACVKLYKVRKISSVVISGDNSSRYYNEPKMMREQLLKGGIPDSIITLDFAGFRTLDSVLRMRDVFGKSTFLVVSQQFHNERAVFLARHHGLIATGYNAEDVAWHEGFKTRSRELLARVKVFVDILVGKEAKYEK